MSTDNNRKKSGGSSGPQVTPDQANQSAKRPNVYGLYGNQVVTNHAQRQATPQTEQTPALQAAESEQAGTEQLTGSEQIWWTENEQVQTQGVEEEETQILRAPVPEATAQVDQRTTTPTLVQAQAPERAKTPALVNAAQVVAPVVVPETAQVVEVVKAPEVPEEQSAMAKRAPQSEAASDKAKADRDAARGRRLSPQEEAQELQLKKAAMAAGLLAQDEKELLRAADAANYDEDEKAEMLIEQGGAIDESVLADQSGEVQALLAAENLPATVAELDRVASTDAKKSPLGENDTIRNVTDMMQLISQRVHKYPDLASPDLSIEQKATKLVELMAYELDVPTLESISSHAYVGLVEDLVFDPQCMLEINRISGGDRNVRVMGSFAAVLWQHAVDALQNRLLSMPDDTRIHETEMFGSVLRNLSMKMYTDALIKPPGNVA